MTAHDPRRLCVAGLAALLLAAPDARAQITPEQQIAQAEAMGLCDPTIPAGVRQPGRLIGCTPQQAAAMGMPAGAATGMSGGGLMGGAGPGGISVGGNDPLNMGPGPAPNPGPKGPGAPKGPGGPRGPGGGPLMGGPTLPSGLSSDIFDRAAAERYQAEIAARNRADAQQAADADRAYNQMEADVLEAMQADVDSAEARAADKKMRAEAAKLRAAREAEKKKAADAQLADYKYCRLIAPVTYDRVMGEIAAEYSREIKAAPEAGRLIQRKREEQEKAALYQRDHSCDHLNPNQDQDEDELAPLTPPKRK